MLPVVPKAGGKSGGTNKIVGDMQVGANTAKKGVKAKTVGHMRKNPGKMSGKRV
jgi:hypothetical protein